MPFPGGADVGGEHRLSTAGCSQEDLLTDPLLTPQTPWLRTVGMSRGSVVVTQIGGAAPGSVVVRVAARRVDVGRGIINVAIGAIGVPQIVTFPFVGQAIAVFGGTWPAGAQFDVVMYATGGS